MMNDYLNIWNGEKFVFTLNKLAQISDGLFSVPSFYQQIADEPISLVTHVTPPATNEKGLVVWVLSIYDTKHHEQYVQHAKKGVIIVSHVRMKDADGNALPMIFIPSYDRVRQVWCRIGGYMKKAFPMPTIAITGSIGKTTTTRFLDEIFRQTYNVFTTGRNRNISQVIVERMIEKFNPYYDYHIQEVGAGAPNVVTRTAEFLGTDAFVFLNVFPQHLNRYITMEGIFQDKSSFDRYAKENTFGVINIDDDMLRNHKFNSRIVTCGVIHTEADYVAENIRQEGIYLKMDIRHLDRRVPICINIPGTHNAYNAVAAFAMAKEWGLSDEEIQAGFMAYRSSGLRQNLREIAGRIVYVDCFNCSAESIHAALHSLDAIEPKAGCKRIAVIGGIGAQGDNSFSLNYETGLKLGFTKADVLIFRGLPEGTPFDEIDKRGGNVHAVYEGARRVIRNRPVMYMDRPDVLADWFVRNTKPGDVILLKGNYKLQLPDSLDQAFGSSIFQFEPVSDRELWIGQGFTTYYYPSVGGSNIIRCTSKDSHITIPNSICNRPLHRVGEAVFKSRSDLATIDFGLSVQNLGAQSFMECTALTNLVVPANVIYIESEAFADCTGLEDVTLEGVLTIETGAFSNCSNLQTVRVTDSCQTIEPNAFIGCPNLTIVAPEGSVAHRYALENGISYKNT